MSGAECTHPRHTVFAQIGIPLVRIHVSEMEEVQKLVGHLERAWNRRTETLMQGRDKGTEHAGRV